MSTIADLMTHDHRACDHDFAHAETLAAQGDWAGAAEALDAFSRALNAHFNAEEQQLFPAFEAATGMTQGPTQVMRGEHVDMRAGLERLRAALEAHDADDFAGEAETLLIMMQQHNMKEENILYPMCDARLGHARDELCTQLSHSLAAEHTS
ncbi:hemerythrin domain-containing protein [Thauera linaloolentis]|uniref:Hemerythrin HHE cation binding domain-containing protein n=1 Tax=Thauera linaloolentis (strain DSM 12138 / JCM 21573 / CCUG 41526 / CIP 105981 / IAM 15112 / NBRC 102519 / 47Lol) TaxID=1123367 RepID=N6ZCP5_THAL4|nr:hemerythrin domain-containing protein [Thauera linaloolentis]ENO89934.1 hemerythrin HHE cation binding domain-containing protein [Thauera linaloolentis 47Lol = DSM 12138]MCM8566639.1 hemerythrin domain-containing protein [Thauera linaloolentis]